MSSTSGETAPARAATAAAARTGLVIVAALVGIYMFSHVSQYLGRRPTFAICLIGAMFATMNVFWNLGKFNGVYDIFWMVPLMGFFQLSIFGGYAVYFPELFPTRLQSRRD